ncbi:endonuclease/exonuclease/phosphatase family protein [Solwaraspora sp. WMMD1047]|uniref:endonuclease/exonuclease/phosphatase family protein n=1 Tax=Solwaraspora sp. WMMD1047 TaxID=3016102 RepID=UPI0024168C94|nr:endonuclease/exonuclease/phosphatase family protein [Solwaraspora sp. WMMD1047]MDG4828357.1 endonuclease/exonuclease/phosphatase family protein [Solwaraspora sp. WMMD1047]
MRTIRALTCLGLVIGAVLATAPAAAAPKNSFRALTFNIHHGAGADGLVDLDRIARVVRSTGADVVGLQEVDRHWSERSGFADQATELARRLKMHLVYGANLDLDPLTPGAPRRQYGTALLSRYRILDWDNTLLPKVAGHEQRGLLRARIVVGRVPVQVYTTHLQHNDAAERLLQAEAIRELVGGWRGPAVLLGDLNATPETPEMTTLTALLPDAWAAAGTGAGHTYPSDLPTVRIDYVLASPTVRVRTARVHNDPAAVAASDHLPVSAVLTVAGR